MCAWDQTLEGVAHEAYNNLVVVTVDVEQYAAWAGQFVPRHYGTHLQGKAFWQTQVFGS